MVYNRFKILLSEKEAREGKRVSYADIQKSTGIAASTLSAWATNDISRYDRETIEKLCKFFSCKVGELIVYEPSPQQPGE